jgi:hypothetical protein
MEVMPIHIVSTDGSSTGNTKVSIRVTSHLLQPDAGHVLQLSWRQP